MKSEDAEALKNASIFNINWLEKIWLRQQNIIIIICLIALGS